MLAVFLAALQAVLYTPGAPLALISEVVEMLGALTIPCLLMVLGANLAKGPGVGTIPISCIAGVALSRLVLLPLVCAAVVLWSASSGLLGPMGRDPLAVLVMLLMNCTPSAVLTHAMATLQRNKPDEAAAMLFWQYAVSLIVLPISIGACLQVCRVAAC